MSESCEILVTEWEEGQVVAGEIILEDGKLSFSATKGYENLIQSVIEGKTFVGTKLFDPANDPEAWLRSLPSFYTGSLVRARLAHREEFLRVILPTSHNPFEAEAIPHYKMYQVHLKLMYKYRDHN